MANKLPQQLLRDRFLSLPRDRRFNIETITTQFGTYYRARWSDHNQQQTLWLGKDRDGTIAAYIETQYRLKEKEKEQPYLGEVTVYDTLGNPLIVDDDLAMFFNNGDSYDKPIYVRDGRHMVFDSGASEHGKYVALSVWLYESRYGEEVKGTYDIVQRKEGSDYTTPNLLKVKKAKKEAKAA